jgi:AcrR family transcriptional regulator
VGNDGRPGAAGERSGRTSAAVPVSATRDRHDGVPVPLADQPVSRHERADAARNRAKVLEAAEHLFAERDARTVTMGDIAKAAGVGRATLYRRYPDPGSVAVALLDEHERQLQERLLSGPPPLGPGAPPSERLAAFYAAMIDLLDRHLHLALGAETGRPRLVTGAYRFWQAHVHELVRQAGVGDPDALADILLAPLAPEVYRSQRDDAGLTTSQVAGALGLLAERLLGPR